MITFRARLLVTGKLPNPKPTPESSFKCKRVTENAFMFTFTLICHRFAARFPLVNTEQVSVLHATLPDCCAQLVKPRRGERLLRSP